MARTRSYVLALACWSLLALAAEPAAAAHLDPTGDGSAPVSLSQTVSAQATATAELLDEEGIVGTGVGFGPDGGPRVVVMLETATAAGRVPASIDGVPTHTFVTGRLRTFPCPGGATGDCSAPVPGGVSVGHPSVTAGTLGAYVEDGAGGYFALSNNHIFAAENTASIGDVVLQPGPADGGTVSNPSHILGTLADYEPILLCGPGGCGAGPTNTIDAAIAAVDSATVQAENFCGWVPQATTVPESSLVPDETQLKKCGRTTGSTIGTVRALNATVDVQGTQGIARFVGQIVTDPLAAGGDSGSLMVDLQDRPVALLFAGSDTATIGTPIDDVLSRFGVSIVDTDPAPPPPANQDPVASFVVSCLGLTCSFDASDSSDPDGSIVSYGWEFGDGATGGGKTAAHAYATAGERTVTLTVTDNAGATGTTTRPANPSDPPPANQDPVASFVVSCLGLTCNFDASDSSDPDGSIVSYGWEFGDGATGGGKTAAHAYATAGERTVTLTVTDNAGATGTTTRTADPTEPPPVPDPPPQSPPPAPPPALPAASIGLVDPARAFWSLPVPGAPAVRSIGEPTLLFYYGNPGDVPFVGDWDCDGDETPGMYRRTDGFVYVRNSNTQGVADTRFFFGDPGDVPLAGDWNGDGCHTVSLYRPSEQRFYIINELGAADGGLGAAAFSFLFGDPGDKPVAGDWDGDGIDEVGLHRESTGLFYWRNTLSTGVADGTIFFGDPGDRFVAGDWGVVDRRDTPAVFRPSDRTLYLRYTLTQGTADATEVTEAHSDAVPVGGVFR